jgi:ABC-type multidrug transport system ATPase subunit
LATSCIHAPPECASGLDSAATLDIVASLRRTARLIDATVAVSLLQPEPEVVALFDEIIVLSEGRVIWHGPASKVRRGRASAQP